MSEGPFLDGGTVGTQKTEGVGGHSNPANAPVAGSMACSALMASKDGLRYLEHSLFRVDVNTWLVCRAAWHQKLD